MNSKTIIHLSRSGTVASLIGAAAVWYFALNTPLPPHPAHGGSPASPRGNEIRTDHNHTTATASDIKQISRRLWQRPLKDPPPAIPTLPPPPPAPPRLRVELIGTAINPGGNAAVLREASGQTRYCVVGSRVDSARVIAIRDGEVVLRHGQHDITLQKEEAR